MLTQIALLKHAAEEEALMAVPGVSELHRIAPGNGFAQVVILRGPDAPFLAETARALPGEGTILLPVEGSRSALDPKYLP